MGLLYYYNTAEDYRATNCRVRNSTRIPPLVISNVLNLVDPYLNLTNTTYGGKRKYPIFAFRSQLHHLYILIAFQNICLLVIYLLFYNYILFIHTAHRNSI